MRSWRVCDSRRCCTSSCRCIHAQDMERVGMFACVRCVSGVCECTCAHACELHVCVESVMRASLVSETPAGEPPVGGCQQPQGTGHAGRTCAVYMLHAMIPHCGIIACDMAAPYDRNVILGTKVPGCHGVTCMLSRSSACVYLHGESRPVEGVARHMPKSLNPREHCSPGGFCFSSRR